MSQERIAKLVAEFDGAIKYAPMLADHPEFTDDCAIAFARKWDDVARQRGIGAPGWNHGIPYCRNDPLKVPRA